MKGRVWRVLKGRVLKVWRVLKGRVLRVWRVFKTIHPVTETALTHPLPNVRTNKPTTPGQGGKHKIVVQKKLSDLGLVELLSAMFDR